MKRRESPVDSCLSLGVRRPGELAFFELEPPPLLDGGVAVRTLFSGFSAGTELTYVKGTDPAFAGRRDPEFGVFVSSDAARRFPVVSMGYMEVAEVIGSRRPGFSPGAIVAAAYGHRSCHVLGASDAAVPLPAGVDPLLGIYLAQMGPICANGLLHAGAEFCGAKVTGLGDGVKDRCVLVTGGGVVGLLTALFAMHHGAREVALADPDPQRLAIAAALGAQVIDQRGVDAWRWCKERWIHGVRDRGADLVFQCRGRSAALHEALRSLRPQGVVIDLAFYTSGAPDLRLGEEFHHNGLTIRCAQISRVPRGLGHEWDRRRLAEETGLLLAAHGDALRRHVITDVVAIEQAPEFVAALARRERAAVQAVFAFGDESGRGPVSAVDL